MFFPGDEDLWKKADTLRPEWVISIEGTIKKRPENLVNPKLETGKIEIEAQELEILNESKTPPFEIGEKDKDRGGA